MCIRDRIKGQSQFSSLQNRGFAASVNYAGENNAILISKNASNTSATLTLPSIGFKKVFTGANEAALESAIETLSERVPLKVSEHEIVLHGACADCAA